MKSEIYLQTHRGQKASVSVSESPSSTITTFGQLQWLIKRTMIIMVITMVMMMIMMMMMMTMRVPPPQSPRLDSCDGWSREPFL